MRLNSLYLMYASPSVINASCTTSILLSCWSLAGRVCEQTCAVESITPTHNTHVYNKWTANKLAQKYMRNWKLKKKMNKQNDVNNSCVCCSSSTINIHIYNGISVAAKIMQLWAIHVVPRSVTYRLFRMHCKQQQHQQDKWKKIYQMNMNNIHK